MNTRVIHFGKRNLNKKELEAITASIEKAIVQINGKGRRGVQRRSEEKYNISWCYQPGSTCNCYICQLYTRFVERLNLTQESALNLIESLKNIQIKNISRYQLQKKYLEHVSIIDLCSLDQFKVKKGSIVYVIPFDINLIPIDKIICEANGSYRSLHHTLKEWKGSFSSIKEPILDALCSQKTKFLKSCRLLKVFGDICTTRGETVSIPVEEIRKRLRSMQHGDLLKIVDGIGPRYIVPDEEFENLAAMKMAVSNSPRTKALSKRLLKDFKESK